MGRARPGEAHHHDRGLQLDLERLGVASGVVLEAQPRRQQPDEAAPDDQAPQPGQAGVGLDGGALRGQPVGQGRVAEVVEPGAAPRLGDQRLRVQVDLEPEPELVGSLLVGPPLRPAQIGDADLAVGPAVAVVGHGRRLERASVARLLVPWTGKRASVGRG